VAATDASIGGQLPAAERSTGASTEASTEASTDDAPGVLAGPSLLEIGVSRLAGIGVPAHEVWLPPLADPPSLDLLLPTSPRSAGSGFGRVPLGWVDRPVEQTRGILELDLGGAAGHVAIVGAPQSGKSTALRTLICALALTHGAAELSVYCLDLGGGSLAALADLPQVGVVAGRLQPYLVGRTVSTVEQLLARRETAFAAAGVSSVADWRRTAAARPGGVPDGGPGSGPDGRPGTGPDGGPGPAAVYPDGFGDLILVVDGWGSLRESFEPLEARLTSIAARGLNYGVHLVLTAARWAEIRPALKDLIGSRIELRLGDPLDSDVNSRVAATVPVNRPGRGLTRDGLHLLTAVPRVGGRTTFDDLPAATRRLVELVRGRWPGRSTPGVRVLPTILRADDLPALLDPPAAIVIGVDEELRPVTWDPSGDRHLMVFGEEQSGRSTLLIRLIRQISARYGLDEARFIVLDPDRALMNLAYRDEQLIASAATGRDAAGIIAANAERLAARLPPPGMGAAEVARHAWWGSPADIYLIVDNYERLTGAAPLTALVPLLEHAADIGLHLIVSRQARGAARAAYDPLYATLKDVGTPALLLSGPETEGTVIGRTRLGPQPPGRGVWVPRRGPELVVQTVFDDPAPAAGRPHDRRER
jgi:S-DNA-T family DNA segregation ATPase FtsK/SpoIIIE